MYTYSARHWNIKKLMRVSHARRQSHTLFLERYLKLYWTNFSVFDRVYGVHVTQHTAAESTCDWRGERWREWKREVENLKIRYDSVALFLSHGILGLVFAWSGVSRLLVLIHWHDANNRSFWYFFFSSYYAFSLSWEHTNTLT